MNIAGKKPKTVVDDNLVFNSTALPEVLQQLSKYFNQKISFDSTNISAMNFTGTITRQDSLPIVLKVIAQMNELEVAPEGDAFIIKKINQ